MDKKPFQVFFTCPYLPLKNSLRISFGSMDSKNKEDLINMVALIEEVILKKHYPSIKYYPCTLPLDQPGFITRVNAGLTIDFETKKEIYDFLGYFQTLLLTTDNPVGKALAEVQSANVLKQKNI